MINPYAALALVAILSTTHYLSYRNGAADCKQAQQEAVAKQDKQDAARAVDLVKSDQKREIRYVEKIKLVQQSSDECLQRDMPADVVTALGGVSDGNRSGTKP